ncbi:MAG: hypothetical protein QMD92_00995 [bacterium]|nr:hypothetical protein [bacterium]
MAKNLYILFGLIFFLTGNGQATSKVLISEVAPCQTKDNTLIDEGDFIELFVKEDINLVGYKLWEGNKTILEFPSPFQIKSSSILLIHVNGSNNLPKAVNETPLNDNNQNGCIDLYSADSGLTATDNTIFLTTPDNILVDFLSYANQDGKWTGNSTWYEKAISSSEWIGSFYEESSFDSSKLSKNYSIGRSNKIEDTNSKHDWFFCNIITPGKINPGIIKEDILLNEIAPNEEQDWIEIYNNSNKDLELDYLILKENDKIIKTFSSLNFNKDNFIVVKLNSLPKDSVNNTINQSNYLEFHSSYASIANTDSVITLEDGLGNIIDALLYSNYDKTLSKQNKEAAIRVIKNKKWQVVDDENLKEEDFIYWNGKKGYSLSRKYTTQVFKDNWSLCSRPTIGRNNQTKDYKLAISNFKIENNPFFIDESYSSKKEAKIIFNLSLAATVSLRIYNVEGMAVKEILRNNTLQEGDYVYSWNGKNKKDSLVPIGIYVVYLEVKSDKQSAIKIDTVIVAKKL